MEAAGSLTTDKTLAVYEKVVREARQMFGALLADDQIVQAARKAVDELIVEQKARVTIFIPVLAMRRVRDVLATMSERPVDAAATV